MFEEMQSCHALDKILPNAKLEDVQIMGVLKAIYRKRALILFDVGMGKTYMSAAYIKMLLNDNPENRFIFLIKHLQNVQTPRELEHLTGVPVLSVSDARASTIKHLKENPDVLNYKVLILTHDFLLSQAGIDYLYSIRKAYTGIIVDEAHNLNNSRDSRSGAILKAICSNFEYRLGLTATPVVSDIKQLARLANIFDGDTYPDVNKLTNDLKKGRFSILEDPEFFIEKSRKSIGIKEEIIGDVVWVDPQPNQRYSVGNKMHKLCKSTGAVNQAETLAEFIRARKGHKGLVYIREHEKREWVLPFLEEAGIKAVCLNGHTPDEERIREQKRFNETNEIDVIITSLTESLNLDCEWVMFYEMTANVQQMLGRAYRGLYDKKLYVYFMLTRDTGEAAYFVENIYKNAVDVQTSVNKCYTAIYDVYNKIIESGEYDEELGF